MSQASIIALIRARVAPLINNAKALLNWGVDVKDECGRTALMRAAYDGSADTVKTLLGRGANVNARDLSDATALTMAIAGGRDEIERLLKEAGAKE
jgi:ankyrin repeat protein